jgi:hypothetical protein
MGDLEVDVGGTESVLAEGSQKLSRGIGLGDLVGRRHDRTDFETPLGVRPQPPAKIVGWCGIHGSVEFSWGAAVSEPLKYVRHGFGAARPYVHGHLALWDMVKDALAAVEIERHDSGRRLILSKHRSETR